MKFEERKPFESGTPSVFTIQSPFQAICAIAIIKQLKIDDYRIKVVYFNYMKERHSQILTTLNYFSMKFDVVNMQRMFMCRYFYLKCLFNIKNRYKRLFVGDFRYEAPYIIGLSYVSNDADVVQMDDGNASISLLQGVVTESLPIKFERFLKRVAKKRNLNIGTSFMTVYSGIKNPRYHISFLNLNSLLCKRDNLSRIFKGVFFIGTNTKTYCETQNIEINQYLNQLEIILKDMIKEYPSERVIYIPHGLENCSQVELVCRRNNVVYNRIDKIVELEIVGLKEYPKAVCGFTSSALYNIKMILPQIRVVNFLIDNNTKNDYYQEYCRISNYYLKFGIELKEVIIHNNQ